MREIFKEGSSDFFCIKIYAHNIDFLRSSFKLNLNEFYSDFPFEEREKSLNMSGEIYLDLKFYQMEKNKLI